MNRLFTTIQRAAEELWNGLRATDPASALAILKPAAPFSVPDLFAPAFAFGLLVTMSVVSGVALAGLGVFLLSVLVLYVICTEILGLRIEVVPPTA